MNSFYIYRTVILTLCIILSVPILGLLAVWTQFSGGESFEGMGLFASSFSLLVFPAMLVLPLLRKNAFVLYIVSELSIICTMWIFWVVSAALAIQMKELFDPFGNCQLFKLAFQFVSDGEVSVQKCNQLIAIEGMTVVVFVLLMKYMLVLLIYSTVVHFRGDSQVWFRTVSELKVNMPALTHNPGDLEAKSDLGTGKDSISQSIPMNTYPQPSPSTLSNQQMMYPSPAQQVAAYTPSSPMPQA
ncbi:hypothetical protein BDZ97DRAFT_1063905 [Flammula alnicola]|nr:hypothetical protein BDZ97DRAFT_1063905 [Flammula alnicola]